MVSAIPVDVAIIVGSVLEGVFYGVFVLICGTTFLLCLYKRNGAPANWVLLGFAFVMFLLCTLGFILDSVNLCEGFLQPTELARIEFLSNPTTPLFSAKHSVFFTMVMVGDSANIYRCFVVWGKRWWVIVPSVLFSLGSAISAYQTIWATEHLANVSIAGELIWGVASFALSIASNVLSTGLIAGRILYSNYRTPGRQSGGSSSLLPAVFILLESNGLTVIFLVVYIIVVEEGGHAIEIMSDIGSHFIALAFCLMIVRVKLKTQVGSAYNRPTYTAASGLNFKSVGQSTNGSSAPMGDIHINRTVETDYTVEMGPLEQKYRPGL